MAIPCPRCGALDVATPVRIKHLGGDHALVQCAACGLLVAFADCPPIHQAGTAFCAAVAAGSATGATTAATLLATAWAADLADRAHLAAQLQTPRYT